MHLGIRELSSLSPEFLIASQVVEPRGNAAVLMVFFGHNLPAARYMGCTGCRPAR